MIELYSGYRWRKWVVKSVALGLFACVFMPHSALALVILQYHHVSQQTPAATSISPELFKAHMQLVQQSGYRVIGLPEVLEALRNKTPLPDKTVLITFDDGSSSVAETALPILKSYQWPFVVFVSTAPVEQRQKGTLSWDDLRTLAAHGAAIANHGVNHTHMIRALAGETEAQWRLRMRQEIVAAEAKIQREIGHNYRAFAYPYGEFSKALLELVAELGFVGFGQHSGAPAARDLVALPRFPFGGVYVDLEDFALKLKALPLPFDQVQYLDSDGGVLEDGVLAPSGIAPIVQYRAENFDQMPELACYVSRQGLAEKVVTSAKTVNFQAQKALNAGRTRYNCTAKSPELGRFYWHSSPFLKPNKDGSWAPEPN